MQPSTQQYIGNDDYRGYLNYEGSQGNAQAKQLLSYVGNDAQYGPNYYTATVGQRSQLAGLDSANQQLYAQYQQNHSYNPNANILSGLGGSYATPPPNWDLTSIYNQAGAGAAAQVNPYYTKQLQDFQNQQTQAKALQQQQNDLTLQNLQNGLQNNLQANDVSRGRTSQDVLTNEQGIGQQADYRQQDQGAQFDQARIAQAKQLEGQGLTASGLGAQQVAQSTTDRNTQEARQGAADQQAVAAQELTKARTFEDLANSDALSKQSEAQGEKQQSIDWDKFVQGQASDLSSEQNSLETSRLAQLNQTQRQLAQQQINDMIHNLSNPQQRLAASSAYAGAF